MPKVVLRNSSRSQGGEEDTLSQADTRLARTEVDRPRHEVADGCTRSSDLSAADNLPALQDADTATFADHRLIREDTEAIEH